MFDVVNEALPTAVAEAVEAAAEALEAAEEASLQGA
jgi:hypothetical protein